MSQTAMQLSLKKQLPNKKNLYKLCIHFGFISFHILMYIKIYATYSRYEINIAMKTKEGVKGGWLTVGASLWWSLKEFQVF